MASKSCLDNQENVRTCFNSLHTSEEKYTKLIALGRKLKPYPENYKTPKHLVKGCQSLLYLKSSIQKGKMTFLVSSDALISAGLAALLLMIYEGEPPETIIKCPPTVLKELDLMSYLSPSRTNGLRSLYLRMQQEAMKILHVTAKT